MIDVAKPFMGKTFVGSKVPIGKSRERYENLLMPDEIVEMEFFGIRDGAIFTDRRMLVMNAQGLLGRKLEFTSFPWRSITAFSVENSGTFDLDAEFKICGSGFGICEVQFSKGADVRAVLRYMNDKIFQ